jgi:hypothetical protein
MPMMHGSFRNYEVASLALSALSAEGIAFRNRSLLYREGPEDGKSSLPTAATPGIGAAGAAAAIATGAVFAGLAATGVGLLVAGPLAGLVAGIGVGGMAGSFAATLASAGLAHEEAVAAQEAIALGRVVAILEVDEGDVKSVRDVFSALADASGVTPDDPTSTVGANEGEGNRTAARRYDEGVEKTVASGRVDALAREAQRAVDDREQGPLLAQAEAAGKRGPG